VKFLPSEAYAKSFEHASAYAYTCFIEVCSTSRTDVNSLSPRPEFEFLFSTQSPHLLVTILEEVQLCKCSVNKHKDACTPQEDCDFVDVQLFVHQNGWPNDVFVGQAIHRFHITSTGGKVIDY
jgi:hypothetical protein